MTGYSNLASCFAVSLYQYNVRAEERAGRLYRHFNGSCANLDELRILVDSPNWATSMAYPTARAYLLHALDTYGEEAAVRTQIEGRGGM